MKIDFMAKNKEERKERRENSHNITFPYKFQRSKEKRKYRNACNPRHL